jgi:nitrite reductase/ring-hydroxylating ferredoxin subunit
MSAPPSEPRPLWREEFPVAAAEERYVSRRQLAKFLALTSLGMLVGNVWLLVKSRLDRRVACPRLRVARIGEIPVGGVTLFRYPTADDPCLLVRWADDAYAAYSQKCPHLSCAVVYAAERHRLECPCHDGVFDVRDGRVLQGPPLRALPRVVLERRGVELWATDVVTREG